MKAMKFACASFWILRKQHETIRRNGDPGRQPGDHGPAVFIASGGDHATYWGQGAPLSVCCRDQRWQILWRGSLGWADKENGLAPTPGTPYGIASLGKSITATPVVVLVEQGKAALDDPVSISVRRKDVRLSGFATANITNEKSDFSLAVYHHLSRKK